MQKNKIDIQREILDDFLNLSYVIKTMSSLENRMPNRKKNHSLDIAPKLQEEKSSSKKTNMIYKAENDWINSKKEDELKNLKNIWEKFKKMNVNSESFNPPSSKSKILRVASMPFDPKK